MDPGTPPPPPWRDGNGDDGDKKDDNWKSSWRDGSGDDGDKDDNWKYDKKKRPLRSAQCQFDINFSENKAACDHEVMCSRAVVQEVLEVLPVDVLQKGSVLEPNVCFSACVRAIGRQVEEA